MIDVSEQDGSRDAVRPGRTMRASWQPRQEPLPAYAVETRPSNQRDSLLPESPDSETVLGVIPESNNISCRDSGRIDIDLNSKLCRRLSRLVARPGDSSANKCHVVKAEPPAYIEAGPRSLRLNIAIQVVGSRGDVQPFIALGQELQRHGHRVRIATHNDFRVLVQDSKLEFFPVGGDPVELMAYMVKNPGLIPDMKGLTNGDVQKKRRMVAEMLRGFWSSCVEPDPVTFTPFVADAIIANPPSFAHIHCAQVLGVPVHLMFTMPWTRTTEFCHPLANLRGRSSHSIPPTTANYVSYLAVEWLTWQGLQDVINDWRGSLDLEPVPFSEGPYLAETLNIPFTYCWSASLVPKPEDWPSYIDVCGFFFRDEPRYTPTTDLSDFLAEHPNPVYIGFGSIVIDEPEKLTDIIVSAVTALGVPAIISKGWAKLGKDHNDNKKIIFIEDCPHEWLFKHVSAVVHHGGAGTTACGLLHGRPTVIVPFFGDQPFWGAMVAAAGAGPAPIPAGRLNSLNLAEAIQFCLTAKSVSAAGKLSEKMKAESGVRRAVAHFHANLPLDSMRCDLIPTQAAVWQYVKVRAQCRLSKAAAEILVTDNLISRSDLKRYNPSSLHIINRRWDPVTAVASSLAATGIGMATSAADIVVKPLGALHGSISEKQRSSAVEKTQHSMDHETEKYGKSAAIHLPLCADKEKHPDRSPYATAVLGAASGVGGFFHSFSKGMLLDLPLAVTEGLRNAPRLYGSEVYQPGNVVDWKSGGVVAAKTLSHGFVDGFKGLITEPIRGAEQGGAIGAVKGAGVGILNLGSKVSSGLLGIVSYPGEGVYQSLRAAVGRDTGQKIKTARWAEGKHALQVVTTNGLLADKNSILSRFNALYA